MGWRQWVVVFGLLSSVASADLATFAGGCFWCMQPPFDKLKGVIKTVSGYTGGALKNPTYEQVSTGTTGHAEAVQITFDPKVTTYDQLLDVFWRAHDSTDAGGSFADRGTQYRSAIFYHSEAQRLAAEKSRNALDKTGKFKLKIATEISPAKPFYPAENYHQDYYKKNPEQYKAYRKGSGREAYLESMWGKDGNPVSHP